MFSPLFHLFFCCHRLFYFTLFIVCSYSHCPHHLTVFNAYSPSNCFKCIFCQITVKILTSSLSPIFPQHITATTYSSPYPCHHPITVLNKSSLSHHPYNLNISIDSILSNYIPTDFSHCHRRLLIISLLYETPIHITVTTTSLSQPTPHHTLSPPTPHHTLSLPTLHHALSLPTPHHTLL